MRRSRLPRWLRAVWLPTLLAVLLVALALLQVRWIGEVSSAEKERFARALHLAARDVALDLDGEVVALCAAFLGTPEDELSAHLRQWRAGRGTDAMPDILAHAYVLEPVTASGLGPGPPRFEIRELGPNGLEQTPASAALEQASELRAVLWPRLSRMVRSFAGRAGPRPPPLMVLPELPGVLLPIAERNTTRGGGFRRPMGRGRDASATRVRFLLLAIDRWVLTERLMPQLVAAHFAGIAIPFELALISVDPPRELLWSTDPDARSWIAQPDDALDCLRLSPRQVLRQAFADASDPELEPQQGALQRPFPAEGPFAERAAWRLLVHRPTGALEQAVSSLTRRNLLLSGAILTLLAGSVALVLLNGRRAAQLARRQSELVAGVTHELHTPLAAIAAAGDNLADGVVVEGEQVRRYGELIRREGRRLRELVTQTLTLAGLEAAAAPLELRTVELRAVLDDVEQEARMVTQNQDKTLSFPSGPLPAVLADQASLRRVVGNLVHNAIKYGERQVWVRVETSAREVRLTVEDDGPGLAREERSRLFEPFFRGRSARERRADGAGLGLHLARRLAEAMGGSIDATNAAHGARFTVHLRRAVDSSTEQPATPSSP